jgi:hypothetical protein
MAEEGAMPMDTMVTAEVADRIWTVLVAEAEARRDQRDVFVRYLTERVGLFGSWEYRFSGSLGFGGKLHYNGFRGAYVTCYPEDLTDERQATIDKVNEQLAEIAPGADRVR